MADTDAVPGFISVPSWSLDGRSSVSVSHIVFVGPTKRGRDGAQQCTIGLEGGVEVVVFLRRPDVLLLIAESIGAIPVGTGAQLTALQTAVNENTRRLRVVLTAAQEASAQVAVLQGRDDKRITALDDKVRDNTRRMTEILGAANQ